MLQELRKRQRTYPGGLLIEEPLEYATNPNIGSYSGTDTFATADHEFATKAQFGMKDLYVSTVLTGDDLDKCSGPDAVLDLARSKMKNAERSLVKEFTRQLFTDGTGNSSKDITGLLAVCDDGTNVATYGGIPRTAETWWKAKYTALSDYISIAAIQAMDGDLTDGQIRPQLRVTTQDIWDDLYELLTPYQRANAAELTAKFGFNAINLNGIKIVVDAQCPSGQMLFLNFDFLHLRPHKRYAEFRFTGWKEPTNQDTKVAQHLWKGNLTCSNCRFQGRIVGITT
jgi:hypothetical protein